MQLLPAPLLMIRAQQCVVKPLDTADTLLVAEMKAARLLL